MHILTKFLSFASVCLFLYPRRSLKLPYGDMSKHSEELEREEKERRGERERERTGELLSGTAKRVVSGKTAVINDIKCLNAVQLFQRKGATAYYSYISARVIRAINIIMSASSLYFYLYCAQKYYTETLF